MCDKCSWECGGCIGFSIVSVCCGIGGAVLSVYCQYLGIWEVHGGSMYVGLEGDWVGDGV